MPFVSPVTLFAPIVAFFKRITGSDSTATNEPDCADG